MARISPLDAGVPTAPFLDRTTGDIAPSWRAFLTALWRRTGGAVGISSDTSALEHELEAERAARIAGDNALGGAIGTEAVARAAQDAQLGRDIGQEAMYRATADNQKLPFGYPASGDLAGTYPAPTLKPGVVCSAWRVCDLSTLPTSDPGHGQPWLSGNHIVVGTDPSIAAPIGLEDDTGRWATESGGGTDWIWG